MARYRFLQDGFVGQFCHQAGSVAELPADWVPGPFVEPLDAEAVQAFFEAGPQPCGLIRQQWSDILLTEFPRTYWTPVDARKTRWRLTGLGEHLGTARSTSDADPLNSLT